MSSGRKCKNCGSSDIETDSSRGDAVCTNCGSVLEDIIIVDEVQFEEGARGTAHAIGQFVSAESRGGATRFGASLNLGSAGDSREITLNKAREDITRLCNQLMLNQSLIVMAHNFYRRALSEKLTNGRRKTHVYGACVYLTCRCERTPHLLIDISDVLQICCYELGRTYLRLAEALHIKIPPIDPCLYILRYAARLQLDSKTQEVATTASRLVQRMKRDSIHSGRRPSGICGAALLMACRMHEFNRSPGDIVQIVKVHTSTLRKRLMEFGDTPSSSLTLEEFMTVDLEEEQDPPSFKAAKRKDKERLKLTEEDVENITALQRQIEEQLEKDKKKIIPIYTKSNVEYEEEQRFIAESTMGTLEQIIQESHTDGIESEECTKELGPDIASMGLASSLEDTSNSVSNSQALEIDEVGFDDIDDAEIDAYIMSEPEYECKKYLWHQRNATYLEEQKAKAERMQKEIDEGKPEKKRRRPARRKTTGPSSSAGEAIEKIIQEKKISAKINYDVLNSLNSAPIQQTENEVDQIQLKTENNTNKRRRLSISDNSGDGENRIKKMKTEAVGLPVFVNPIIKTEITKRTEENEKTEESNNAMSEEEIDEYFDEEEQPAEDSIGVAQILRQHREGEDDEEYGYDYGYEDNY